MISSPEMGSRDSSMKKTNQVSKTQPTIQSFGQRVQIESRKVDSTAECSTLRALDREASIRQDKDSCKSCQTRSAQHTFAEVSLPTQQEAAPETDQQLLSHFGGNPDLAHCQQSLISNVPNSIGGELSQPELKSIKRDSNLDSKFHATSATEDFCKIAVCGKQKSGKQTGLTRWLKHSKEKPICPDKSLQIVRYAQQDGSITETETQQTNSPLQPQDSQSVSDCKSPSASVDPGNVSKTRLSQHLITNSEQRQNEYCASPKIHTAEIQSMSEGRKEDGSWSSMLLDMKNPKKARLGVRGIWVSGSVRKTGVASALLDAAR